MNEFYMEETDDMENELDNLELYLDQEPDYLDEEDEWVEDEIWEEADEEDELTEAEEIELVKALTSIIDEAESILVGMQRKVFELNETQDIEMRNDTDNNSGAASDTTRMTALQQMLGNINAAGAAGQSTFQRFGGSLKEAFSTYTMANMLQDGIYKVVDAGKQGLETVKSFNDIKTDLAMAREIQ